MIRLYTILLFLSIPIASVAQNYMCFPLSASHFFINQKGYLRGTRIDSVKTIGQSTVLYPFHSPRGYYMNNQQLDVQSGSWIGKTITVLPNGTHFFDNFWGDTVIIKTQAGLNDSWDIYNNGTDTFYTATITAIDTMTVLNVVDSVKIITLTARNSTGILSTDPLHNKVMIISKNNGLVQSCDLFMFPLHEPGKWYAPGFDYFLDKYSYNQCDDIFFTLTDFHNPSLAEIYDFEAGDVFEYKAQDNPQWGSATESITLQEVNNKQITPQEIIYTLSGWVYTKNYGNPNTFTTVPFTTQFKRSAQQYLLDLSKMPEETGQKDFFTFKPHDTTYCLQSPLYSFYSSYITGGIVNTFEPCGYSYTYKTKLGEVNYGRCDDPPILGYYRQLQYSKKNGKDCGIFIPLSIDIPGNIQTVSISPNPAHDLISIKTNNPERIQSVAIINSLGQTIGTYPTQQNEISIPVSDLPNGMYMLSLTEVSGTKTIHKISVQH